MPCIHAHVAPYPEWLHILAWTYISVCLACALALAIDTLIRPQTMAIMSLVWPITALYMGPVTIALYLRSLPVSQKKLTSTSAQMQEAMERTKDLPPTPLQNAIAVFHCGAGCSIGDLIAESIVPTLGLIFAGGSKLILDFVFAYIFGIVFQYATIAPMRGLSFGKGIVAAIRADTISITLFEIGMFGWMAITYFLLFPKPHLDPGMAVFWFMMEIAMIAGFFTSIPASAWLQGLEREDAPGRSQPDRIHAAAVALPAKPRGLS